MYKDSGVCQSTCWSLKLSGHSLEVLTMMIDLVPRYDSGVWTRLGGTGGYLLCVKDKCHTLPFICQIV
jgi:hypothetical protein